MASALIREIQAGSRAPTTELYEETWNELNGFFLGRGLAIEDAEDLFQEAFIIFLNYVKRDKGMGLDTPKSCKSFITGVVKIKVKEHFRKSSQQRKNEERYKENHKTLFSDSDDLSQEKIDLIAQKMGEIDDTCRRILRMFYFEKLELEEILTHIESLNSVGSLKVKKSRCLARLRKLVQENGSRKKQDRVD